MGAAYFYHLTRAPLEVTLPMLLGKAQQAGWRVAVRGRDQRPKTALASLANLPASPRSNSIPKTTRAAIGLKTEQERRVQAARGTTTTWVGTH